jgi:hypothetical protein
MAVNVGEVDFRPRQLRLETPKRVGHFGASPILQTGVVFDVIVRIDLNEHENLLTVTKK